MEIVQIRKNLQTLPDEIEVAEREYLFAKAQLEYMDDLKKRVISKQKTQHKGLSNVEKEDLAHSSEAYRIHIEGRKAQAELMNDKAVIFHKLERQFEAMRSLNKNV